MSAFMPFEQQVVRTLLSPHMEADHVDAVLNAASVVSYEHTGVGYFLTVRHPTLPLERVVCSAPTVTGMSGGVNCGFVVFLEHGALTLECHAWGDASLPEDFRTQHVQVACAA